MKQKTGLGTAVTLYSFGNLFVRSLSFVLLPMYSNCIAPAEFGNFSLLMGVYAIGQVLYVFGMQGALNKFYIEQADEQKKKVVFSTIYWGVAGVTVPLTLLLVLLAPELSPILFGDVFFNGLLRLLFTTLFFETLGSVTVFLLITREQPKQAVTVSAASAIVNLLLNIWFVSYCHMGIRGIMIAQYISGLVLLTGLYPLLYKNLCVPDATLLKKVFLFALPLLLANLLTASNNVADRFFINALMGKDEVGLYGFAYRIAISMSVFITSFGNAWNPHSLNAYYANEYRESFGKTFNRLVAFGCLLLLTVSLFIVYAFEIQPFGLKIFNPAYKAGIIIIAPVMTGYLLKGVAAFFSVYPSVAGKSYHILIADVLAFAVNMSLNYMLIPVYGIMGAAFATTEAFAVCALYLFFISRKELVIQYRLKELTRIVLPALAILFISLQLHAILYRAGLFIMYMVILNFFTDTFTEVKKKLFRR